MKLGAYFAEKGEAAGCHFTVWAPLLKKVQVEVVAMPDGGSDSAQKNLLPMTQDARGYWHTGETNLPAGTQYFYQLEGADSWPDPASQFQPEGVMAPHRWLTTVPLTGQMMTGRA